MKIKKKINVMYSKQQMIDCCTDMGCRGCNGGWPGSGLDYLSIAGIAT